MSYHGVTSSSQELNFASGALSLKEASGTTKDDSESTVHEELAKENTGQLETKLN